MRHAVDISITHCKFLYLSVVCAASVRRAQKWHIGTRQNAERSGSAGQIRTVTICGSLGPICGLVITVALRLGLTSNDRAVVRVRVRRLVLGLG